MISDIIHAQQVILLLKEKGIEHIVISPGSRNAPLTLSFSNDSFFTCYSIVDERCAAHFALGMAQQVKKPVVVVCTSGSALLNYYPAVTEAFYSEIPLMVLSADRPPYKIDIGDGQTIRQQQIYANHIIYDTQLEMIDTAGDTEAIKTNERVLNKAINSCISLRGPVHINVPFEEPLYNTVEESSLIPALIPVLEAKQMDIPDSFIENWNSASRKFVILSTLSPGVFPNDVLHKLIQDSSVLVLTEVSSNVVIDDVIWSIDSLIAPIERDDEIIKDLRPDMVVTIGGMIVSKKIKQFLRKYPPHSHYHIGHRKAYDTFFKLTGHIKLAPQECMKLLPQTKWSSNYRDRWLQQFQQFIEKRATYLQQMPWCDFKVFEKIFAGLPNDIVLQLGNSSTIRYAQLFRMKSSHDIYANRGTSGIDGCTSTAIGAAVASSKPTVFITGDLSFFYDANALWNNYIPTNFKIIIVNNSGGGIFRILPGANESDYFQTYFETTHQLDASHLCAMHGVAYHRVDEEHAFAKAYTDFLNNNSKPQLIEIFTPRLENDTVLLEYFKFLK